MFGWSWAPAAMIVAAGSEARRANGAVNVGAADGAVVGRLGIGGEAGRIWALTCRRGIRAAVVVARNLARGRDSVHPYWDGRTFGAGWRPDTVSRRTSGDVVWRVRRTPWRPGRRAGRAMRRCTIGMECSCVAPVRGRRLGLCIWGR